MATTTTQKTIGAYKGVPIFGGSDAYVSEQMKAVDAKNLPATQINQPINQAVQQNTQVTTPAIKVSDLTPTQPVNIPTPQPTQSGFTSNVAQPFLDEIALTESEQAAQKGQENIVAKMLQNITAQAGESAYRSELLQGSGLTQLKQDLQGINSQILQKQAEIAQDDVKLVANMRAEERRDTLLPFAQAGQAKLAGDAAIVRALKTSEIGVLNALALGKQGDIALAKESIQEAVDAKYAPYKEQNAIFEAQLKAIEPLLTAAEKKQALAQQFKLNQANKEIDRVSTLQSKFLSNAIEQGAPQSVINALSKAGSIEEITRAGKGYEVSRADRLEQQLKQAQLANTYSQIAERAQTAKTGKPPTEAQQTANIYANRIANSNKTLTDLAPILSKMTYAEFKALQSDSVIANRRLSPEAQQAGQAMRDFINATLRRESGAAIAPSEFENARKQYFPQFGDKEAVLKQKATNRAVVEKGLIQAAGNAYVNLTPEKQKQNFWDTLDQTFSGSTSNYQQAGYPIN